MDLEEIFKRIRRSRDIDGVTFSGGEPFLQADSLAVLAEKIRILGLHLMIFTGYNWEQLREGKPGSESTGKLLHLAHVLVDGPYQQEKRDLSLPFCGSSNQRIINVPASLENGYVVTMNPGRIMEVKL